MQMWWQTKDEIEITFSGLFVWVTVFVLSFRLANIPTVGWKTGLPRLCLESGNNLLLCINFPPGRTYGWQRRKEEKKTWCHFFHKNGLSLSEQGYSPHFFIVRVDKSQKLFCLSLSLNFIFPTFLVSYFSVSQLWLPRYCFSLLYHTWIYWVSP